jgi:hypothetical protein
MTKFSLREKQFNSDACTHRSSMENNDFEITHSFGLWLILF